MKHWLPESKPEEGKNVSDESLEANEDELLQAETMRASLAQYQLEDEDLALLEGPEGLQESPKAPEALQIGRAHV